MLQEDSSVLPSCIPLPIEDVKLLNDVIDKAKDWALMHGAAMRSKDNFNPDVLQFAPFILTPSSFPREEFKKAQSLQVIINELMHNVAHDTDFLRETLANAIIADDFTGNLFKIYEKVLLDGINQPISLGLLRSDVMLESRCPEMCKCPKSYCCWKQVEINTIASGFGHLGPISKDLQRNDKIVSVIYFRAGYVPDHYPTQNEWDARYLMEKSKAIKCPSIQYHLAGTKKVQQALAKPGILTRFLREEYQVKAISDIFTGLYTLDDTEEGDKAAQMAITNPERFVMKPQREGGGHNIYGDAIPDTLKDMSKSERSAWILMDLIAPPITKGYMIRPGGAVPPPIVELVSELGIFGAIIGTKDKIIYNCQAGHMLRTKLATANEGGVAAGLGALDSPYLFDEN